mmetsp:Transcript_15657/g.39023  ORF Transcript_15657/g.39023 Transcript_15657/m.39023 type:complete len:605 (-) Transcript_15657:799-2613(-)
MGSAVQRRVYRSLLQCVRQFKRDGVPLVGVVQQATLGQQASQPPGSSLPPGFGGAGDHHAVDLVHVLRREFKQPSGRYSIDDAFTVLRSLHAQRNTLLGAEEETVDALRSWRRILELHSASARGLHGPHMGSAHAAELSSSRMASTQQLARAAEAACSLVHQLWQAGQLEGLEELEGLAGSSDSDADEVHAELSASLSAQGGLGAVLDALAAEVARHEGPSVFPAGAAMLSQRPNASSPPSPAAPHTSAPHQRQVQQLEAIRKLLFSRLKLRNEPIEWVYDGLGPLLLPGALQRRKAAPMAMAVVALGLCARLGVPATLLRATAPLHATASPAGQRAAAGMGAAAAGMPAEVAARYAGRAASALPLDAWVLATLVPADTRHLAGAVDPSSSLTSGTLQPGQMPLVPSGVYLDVSCRRGEVLGATQLGQRYPAAAAAAASLVDEAARGVYEQGAARRAQDAHVVWVCGQLARAVMVAHQRRGESDAVAHWLYQVLALDARAPEWGAMAATTAAAAAGPASAASASAPTAPEAGSAPLAGPPGAQVRAPAPQQHPAGGSSKALPGGPHQHPVSLPTSSGATKRSASLGAAPAAGISSISGREPRAT